MSAPRCRSVSSSSASAAVASSSRGSSSLAPVGHVVVSGSGNGWVWYREQCSHRCINGVAAKLCGLLLRFLLRLLRFTQACWLLLRFLLRLLRLKHPAKAVHTCIHAIKPVLRNMIRINAIAAKHNLIERPFLQSRWQNVIKHLPTEWQTRRSRSRSSPLRRITNRKHRAECLLYVGTLSCAPAKLAS